LETDHQYQPLLTIGAVAKTLQVSEQMVRLYEESGLVLPERTGSNRRMYSLHDLERLQCIRTFIDEHGMTLNGIRRLLSFLPCWEYQGGLDADCEQCAAYYSMAGPCWSQEPVGPKCAEQNCRDCEVYRLPVNCDTLKSIIFQRDPFTRRE